MRVAAAAPTSRQGALLPLRTAAGPGRARRIGAAQTDAMDCR